MTRMSLLPAEPCPVEGAALALHGVGGRQSPQPGAKQSWAPGRSCGGEDKREASEG